jgi:hypothetical protein
MSGGELRPCPLPVWFRKRRSERPSSSLGEENRPVISAAIGMYGLHTSGQWSLAEDRVIERDFCKGDEEQSGDTSA